MTTVVSEADAFGAFLLDGGGLASVLGVMGVVVVITVALVFLVAGVNRVGKL